jgi:hypothetical protein
MSTYCATNLISPSPPLQKQERQSRCSGPECRDTGTSYRKVMDSNEIYAPRGCIKIIGLSFLD